MVDEFNQAKRRRSSRKSKSKSTKRNSTKRKSNRRSRKRPLNAYFKQMLAAKKLNKSSFEYNGNTYVGERHEHLGMIYRKK